MHLAAEARNKNSIALRDQHRIPRVAPKIGWRDGREISLRALHTLCKVANIYKRHGGALILSPECVWVLPEISNNSHSSEKNCCILVLHGIYAHTKAITTVACAASMSPLITQRILHHTLAAV
jgi:hypothetical protein